MNDYVIPNIGTSGRFVVSDPYTTVISPDDKYTVKAIRTISELESNGIDVKTTRYINNGLEELDYIRDLEADMHIVTLQSGYGQWYEIPARYIREYPRIDGVAYHRRNIVIKFPMVPKDSNLSLLEEELRNIAADYVGTAVGSAMVSIGGTKYIDNEVHRVKQATRRQQAIKNPTVIAKVRELKRTEAELRAKIAALEQYIIEKGI